MTIRYSLRSTGGGIAVSFFFILSGFLEFKHLSKYPRICFAEHIKTNLHRKRKYILGFIIYLILSAIYCLIIHRYTFAEVIYNCLINLLCIPVILPNFNNALVSSSWFFMCLIILEIISWHLYKIINAIQAKHLIFILFLSQILFNFISHKICIGLSSWLIYNSIYSRIFDYSIGFTLSKMRYASLKTIKFASIKELLSLLLVFYMVPRCYTISGYSENIIVCAYLIYVFSFQQGILSKIFRKNKIIDILCSASYSIYMFHYILLKYSFCSPWSENIYLHLIVVLLVIILLDQLMNKSVSQ